ncbi:hypothetical protein BH10PSE12_BH10PSE12_05800 [soil metagenome]
MRGRMVLTDSPVSATFEIILEKLPSPAIEHDRPVMPFDLGALDRCVDSDESQHISVGALYQATDTKARHSVRQTNVRKLTRFFIKIGKSAFEKVDQFYVIENEIVYDAIVIFSDDIELLCDQMQFTCKGWIRDPAQYLITQILR